MPSATRTSRRQPADVRRQQILDAAERVLLERGLSATTVSDVAEAAGVAKGTMYLYFRSKNELLAELRARYLSQYASAMEAKPDGTAVERIRALVVGLYSFGVKGHELHHLLFHEAGFSEHDAFTVLRLKLTTLIDEGVRAGEFAVDDVAVTVSFLLHGVHGTLIESLHSPQRRIRRTADQIAILVDHTLDAR